MNRATEAARPLRDEFNRLTGWKFTEIAEFDLALAHLRVPETVRSAGRCTRDAPRVHHLVPRPTAFALSGPFRDTVVALCAFPQSLRPSCNVELHDEDSVQPVAARPYRAPVATVMRLVPAAVEPLDAAVISDDALARAGPRRRARLGDSASPSSDT